MKVRRLVAVAVATAVVITGAVAAATPAAARPLVGGQPLPLEGVAPPPVPTVTAESWILYDETYDRILGTHEAATQRAMASTTKMMTAIVALERADPNDLVTVSETAAGVGEAEIDLVVGERIPLRDLVTAMLLQSANDAAFAIAEHVAGDVERFVALMNDEAADLGLVDTAFVNPHGLDAEGHHSSAEDLLALARHGMANPEFARMVGLRSYELPDDPSGNERVARNTNELIGTYEGAFGVKTGFTNAAGLTLVAGAERDGRRVYAVVMGSQDHFAEAAALMSYGFSEYQLLAVIDPGEIYAQVRTPAGALDAVAVETLEMFASSTEAAALEVTPTFRDGQVTAVAEVGGEPIGERALMVEEPAELPGLLDAVAWASRYWDWVWGRDG